MLTNKENGARKRLGKRGERLFVKLAAIESAVKEKADNEPPNNGNSAAIEAAETACKQGRDHGEARHYDLAWGELQRAERILIGLASEHELIARATSLESEIDDKLTGWRKDAALKLIAMAKQCPSDEGQQKEGNPLQLRKAAYMEALSLLHEGQSNSYYRAGLMREQLSVCGVQMAVVTCLIAVYAINRPFTNLTAGKEEFLGVLAFGMLGALLSVALSTGALGDKRVTQIMETRAIAWTRPVVGTVSALIIYTALRSGFIDIFDKAGTKPWMYFTAAIVAGFSEQMVSSALQKLDKRQDAK